MNFGPQNFTNVNPFNGSIIARNFSLLNSVTFGPTGVEYTVPMSRVVHVDYNTIHVNMIPGTGQNLHFRVTVAGVQVSGAVSLSAIPYVHTPSVGDMQSAMSLTAFSFVQPTITHIWPSHAATLSPPDVNSPPTIITLGTSNLPFLDPTSRLQVRTQLTT